jgi:hypothetical protein
MSATRPPTTPPAIAPTLLFFEFLDDELVVLDGKIRVGVRVTEGAESV